jgi:hypothetical protein
MSAAVTIHGGQGSDTISFAFTVTGTNTTRYATNFATNVNNILASGSPTPISPDASAVAAAVQATTEPVYVLATPSPTSPTLPSFTVPGPGYVLDTISGAAGIALAGNDTVLVAAINAEATVTGAGADNQVIFVDGNNTFVGTADLGGDTVVAGSGFDTIYTSAAGQTTVNSGTGDASIYLQDTTAASAGAINDFVYIDDGANTVYANGASDAVIATTEGQTVYGDSVAGGNNFLGVLFASNSDGTPNGNDLVNAQASSTVSVYDYSSNNTVIGGSGVLYFLGGNNVTATIDGGNGGAYVFGSAGDSITLSATAADTGFGYFVAGGGNETLNGAGSTQSLYLTGGQPDSTGAAVNDSITGGSGFNLLTAGGGSETLGGAGLNYFQISDSASAGATLTLNDFAVSGNASTLILDGFSASDLQALYNATSDNASGSLQVTIGDNTTITFTGITTGSQLVGHVVTF